MSSVDGESLMREKREEKPFRLRVVSQMLRSSAQLWNQRRALQHQIGWTGINDMAKRFNR